jgi:hypothetical protein
VRVKEVCETCNNGWMSSRIEALSKPAVEAMVLGRTHCLAPREQAAVARYAFRVAAMLEYVNTRQRAIPRAHYEEFYRTQNVPSDVVVWIFGLPRQLTSIADSHMTGFTSNDADFSGLYVVTFALGLLGLQVVGLSGRKAPIDKLAERLGHPGLQRIWPMTGRFDLPPFPLPARAESDPLRAIHERIRVESPTLGASEETAEP